MTEDDGDGRASGVLPEDCLPADFPDDALISDAEVAFECVGEAMVEAVALVFTESASAATAWAQLARRTFAERFASSVGADAGIPDDVELLGPDLIEVDMPVVPGATLAGTRAVFAAADVDIAHRIVLDLVVLARAERVVLLWCASRGEREQVEGWDGLVGRVAGRLGS